MNPLVSISIVSHGQGALVSGLMCDIAKYCRASRLEVILTINIPEDLPFSLEGFEYPVRLIENAMPKGFAANHNQAFTEAEGDYFCVVNPDIRLCADPFDKLIDVLRDHHVGVVSPLVVDPEGHEEDHARDFPRPAELIGKFFGKGSAIHQNEKDPITHPDWVAGMFMLFRTVVFRELNGFDERYFLYYEDVDLCGRLTLAGYSVALSRTVRVVHHARRSSHRNLRYALLHLTSIIRFFISPVYRRLRCRRPA